MLFREQRNFKGYFSFFVIKKKNIPLTLKRKNILFLCLKETIRLLATKLNFIQSLGTILCEGQFAEQVRSRLSFWCKTCKELETFLFFAIKKRKVSITSKEKKHAGFLLKGNNSQASCTEAKLCSGNKIMSFRTCFGI